MHSPFRRPGAVLAAALAALLLQGLHTAPEAEAGTRTTSTRINIVANHSGLCVEADNSRVTDGTLITQNRCTGQQGATWVLRESVAGTGAVNLHNPGSGKCLELAAPTPSGLRLAQLGACNDTPASSFRVEDRQHHAWLRSVEDPSKCLEVAAGSHVNHTVVRLAPCNDQSGTAFRQRPPRSGDDTPRDPERFGVERVSITSFGEQAAEGLGEHSTSGSSSLSSDNRHVAFAAAASTLVNGDTNGWRDIFVRDRHTAEIRRVNVPNGGGQADGPSYQPMISGDGRFVVFHSAAANLAPGDANSATDVFLYDADTRKIELISKNTDGQIGTQASSAAVVSADGRYVAFDSYADNLVTGDTNAVPDVFLRDRSTGVTRRISVASGGGQADGRSTDPSISADGRYIAFTSRAGNLVPGDANNAPDVFLWDTQSSTLRRVTAPATAHGRATGSAEPVISANGSFVAFTSDLPLVAEDTNSTKDVYTWNRRSGAISRASVSNSGAQTVHESYSPSISGNGLFVAFASQDNTLVPGTGDTVDVFVRDQLTGTTVKASANDEGVLGNGSSYYPEMSADGKFVSFESNATNLVFGDTNAALDLFVKPVPLDLT